MKKVNRVISLLVMLMLVASCIFSVTGMRVSAAAYNGKGTKSDPYLVQTAEQLQGMKDNLSAHYKLANTIDLSGFGEFQPIGNLAQPFTGSFTCDMDSDGTPKYAIKNLTVYNHAGEKNGHKVGANHYIDYVEKKSNWETALFGAAEGATFKNIALINVKITNTVIGQHQTNSDWSRNPGQDEMATATLVAIGNAITVERCFSSGTIDSKSNHTGGMFGRLTNSSVKNSYSSVNVKCSGYWNIAGFLSGGDGNTLTNCGATGNLETGRNNTGGFLGSGMNTCENCYSTGSVAKGKSFHDVESTASSSLTLKNCVSLGKVSEKSNLIAEKKFANCYVLSAAEGGFQDDFTVGAASQIQSIINTINQNLVLIKDTSKYVPGAVDLTNATESTTTDNADNTNSAESVVQDEESATKMSAEELVALTADLLDKTYSKKLTLEEALEGLKLQEYYVELDDTEKATVTDVTTNAFATIREECENVIIRELTKRMEKLPLADEVTIEDAKEIVEVWEIYDGLPDSVKEFFKESLVKNLTACYEIAKDMANVKIVNAQVDTGLSKLQNVLIIVLVVLNVIALTGLGVLMFFIVKALNKLSPKEKRSKERKKHGFKKKNDI